MWNYKEHMKEYMKYMKGGKCTILKLSLHNNKNGSLSQVKLHPWHNPSPPQFNFIQFNLPQKQHSKNRRKISWWYTEEKVMKNGKTDQESKIIQATIIDGRTSLPQKSGLKPAFVHHLCRAGTWRWSMLWHSFHHKYRGNSFTYTYTQ